jgi:hypothetical protein
MKHIRVTVRPDRGQAPRFVRRLLDASVVTQAQALDWNRGASATSTHLYGVAGDGESVAAAARETSGVEGVRFAPTDGPAAYLQLVVRDPEVPLFGGAAAAIDRTGLVVRRPLHYRDGRITGHIVGDPDVLQAAIDEMPPGLSADVEAIREFPSGRLDPATTLSPRQREAVETALDLGYYELPRATTHADVGDALGCAPNTASQHLRKAEAKLVRAGMDALDASR